MRTLIALIAFTAVATPTVVTRIPVSIAAAPCAAAAGGRFVWVSEYGAPYLLKIDPRTNRVVARTGIGTGSCGLGYGAGSLWIEDTSSSTVSRVSVATGKRIKAIRVGITPYDATFAYGAAWVTANTTGELERIDPAANRVVKRWKLPQATGVVGALGALWAAGPDGVIRVDPSTNTLAATIPVTGGASWTAASADAVWVTTPTGVARIDPQSNSVDHPPGRALPRRPGCGRRQGLGAADPAKLDRGRRPGDEQRRADGQGRRRPVRRHRDQRRGLGAELEGARHLAHPALTS